MVRLDEERTDSFLIFCCPLCPQNHWTISVCFILLFKVQLLNKKHTAKLVSFKTPPCSNFFTFWLKTGWGGFSLHLLCLTPLQQTSGTPSSSQTQNDEHSRPLGHTYGDNLEEKEEIGPIITLFSPMWGGLRQRRSQKAKVSCKQNQTCFVL